MAVDLDALKRASEGDQSKKVTVSKVWLAEVHRMLSRAQMDDRLATIGEKLMGMGVTGRG